MPELKLFVWKIPSVYGGFAVGYTRDSWLCVLARDMKPAIELAEKKIERDVLSSSLKQHMLNIIKSKIVTVVYDEGDVISF